MMKVSYVAVLLVLAAACAAAPSSETPAQQEDEAIKLFSGVTIEKDSTGSDLLNVKFKPGELHDAARTFEEARGKIKKYAPLLAGLGVKVVAVVGILFGGLTLLVTKALVVAKLAFLAAAALGLQKLISGGGLSNFGGKINPWQSTAPQWSAPSSSAAYPYARSSSVAQDSNDLAYKAQIPS